MMRGILKTLIPLLVFLGGAVSMSDEPSPVIVLPPVDLDGPISVETALNERRSVRDYSKAPLSLKDVSQLLWAAQGITSPRGFRTAPSAGALYPLEVYLVAGNVAELEPGVYRYRSKGHVLEVIEPGDQRGQLSSAALGQSCIKEAGAVIVITAVYERTADKYGARAVRYVRIETGQAAQNIYLQAVSRNLGIVLVGAFDDSRVQRILHLPDDHLPLGLMPVGRIKR